jgi:hypothetical protein
MRSAGISFGRQIALASVLSLAACTVQPHDSVREAIMDCQYMRPANAPPIVSSRPCSRAFPDWAQGCTAKEWRQGHTDPQPAPASIMTTNDTAPYWRCIRDDAASKGADASTVYILTKRLMIADRQDAGTLKGDDLDLALTQLAAEAQQDGQAQTEAVEQRIQTINSF